VRREDLRKSMKRLNRRLLARCRCTSGNLGIEKSADLLEELSHTPEPWSTSAGIRFTRAASQCPVGMWIGREFAAATSLPLLLDAGAMEFCLAGEPALPSANE
jgi:hypothetical protein